MHRNSRELDIDANGERLESLHISSLDDDEDEDEPQNDDVEDDASDEDDDEEDRVPMKLGFTYEPKNSWSLLRQYFPSKAGGTPVYAPLPKESTYHRTLFVFMCPSMACLLLDQHEQWRRHPETPSRSVKVFRCQLPEVNSFYSSGDPAEDGTEKPLTAGALLCNWCGTWKGDQICSRCRRARYCSVRHQTAHWRSSNSSHRVFCRQLESSGQESESAASNSLWPQYEITSDDEEISNDNGSVNSLVSRSRTYASFEQLQTYFNGHGDNRSWASFQERISLDPDQVLRYSSSAQANPIWPVSSGRPSRLDIPKCNYCSRNRRFEFQVLPQLLFLPVGYKEEFAWVQLASQSISR